MNLKCNYATERVMICMQRYVLLLTSLSEKRRKAWNETFMEKPALHFIRVSTVVNLLLQHV